MEFLTKLQGQIPSPSFSTQTNHTPFGHPAPQFSTIRPQTVFEKLWKPGRFLILTSDLKICKDIEDYSRTASGQRGMLGGCKWSHVSKLQSKERHDTKKQKCGEHFYFATFLICPEGLNQAVKSHVSFQNATLEENKSNVLIQ